MVEAVDLFCGAGGLTLGLQRAGIHVRRGYDLDPACEFPFTANTAVEFVKADISQLTSADVASVFSSDAIRLIAGCAPCQTFSTYTRGPKAAKSDDGRWSLLSHFSRIVKDVLPELITMENVPRVREYPAFKSFLSSLRDLEYEIWQDVVDCSELGAPQKRKRLVLIASRVSTISGLEPITNKQTVRDAIAHLARLVPGQSHPDDRLHYASALSEINMRRVKATPESGDWRDWPEDLKLECHKRESGKTYRGVYGRMSWDHPAPTLTTLCCGIGNGRFVHPDQDRGVSLREAAILQTFPANFVFFKENERIKPRVASRLIGNAVPPLLGEAIGRALVESLVKSNPARLS